MTSLIDRVTDMLKNESNAAIGLTPKLQSPPLVLLPAQTEAQKLAHFTAELDSALRSLDQATAQSTETRGAMQKLSGELGNRGFWDAFKSNFTGQTDKDLAKNIQTLGGSLETTQKVIRVMLHVQTHKGRLLHTFSDALVNKIAHIQTDTQTLDGNQRATALAFLEELHQQVQEQISQQELIERHEQQLLDFSQWQFEKNSQDAALEQQLKQQRESNAQWQTQKDLRDVETMHQLQSLGNGIETLKRMMSDLAEWRQDKQSEDIQLRARIVQAEQHVSRQLDQMVDSIATSLGAQARQKDHAQLILHRVDALQTRIAELENAQARAKSFTAALLRHGLSVMALCVAVVALINGLRF